MACGIGPPIAWLSGCMGWGPKMVGPNLAFFLPASFMEANAPHVRGHIQMRLCA
jgi:hypothetical protein